MAEKGTVVFKKEMTGNLQRQQTGMFNRWKTYYYECKGGKLKEYPSSSAVDDSKVREIIDLSGSYVEDGDGVTQKQFSFILSTKTESYYFVASSDVEKMKWVQTLGGRMMMRKANYKANNEESLPPLILPKDGPPSSQLNAPLSPSYDKINSSASSTNISPSTSANNLSPPLSPPSSSSSNNNSNNPNGLSSGTMSHSNSLTSISSTASNVSNMSIMSTSNPSLGGSGNGGVSAGSGVTGNNLMIPGREGKKKEEKEHKEHKGHSSKQSFSAPSLNSLRGSKNLNRRSMDVQAEILKENVLYSKIEAPMPEIGLRMEFNSSVIIPAEKYYILESIRFSLLEGRNFKGKKKPNLYVNIYIDGMHKGRSSIQWGNNSPFWSENFLFEDVGDARLVLLRVCTVGSRDNKLETNIVGEADVSLKTIGKGVTWVLLKTKNEKDSKNPAESPAISVEAIKQRLKILPVKEYAQFAKTILAEDLTAPKVLASLIGSGAKIEEVARRLLNIFLLNDKGSYLACALAADEICHTETPSILFRGNSLATKVIDLYMKEYAEKYLQYVLRAPIEAMYIDKQNCEVDPTRLDKIVELQGNRERLVFHIKSAWNSIRASADEMPWELKQVFKSIREEVELKFTNDENLKYIAVVGFAFLRFFCPGILNPYLFGIMDDHPDETSKRTLTLVAKTLQNLANLVEFGEKESYMVFLNPFIIDNKKELKNFVDAICEVSTEPQPPTVLMTNRYINKEYAYLYNFFQDYKEKLREYEEHNPDPKLKEFFRVFMKLEFTYSLHDKD